jgi:hydroxymethylbilane synthase
LPIHFHALNSGEYDTLTNKKMKCSTNKTLLLVVLNCSTHCCTSLSLTDNNLVRIGTRFSKLAQTQARQFQEILHKKHKDIKTEILPIDALGDKTGVLNKTSTQQLPLAIQGVDFTGALDEALADGIVDVVVHSLKDVPPANRWRINADAPRITIGAYLGPRENPLDVLVSKKEYKSIMDLPAGAKVGSASLRRQAQLLACRPDLDIINIRGNIDDRLIALDRGELDGLILAFAGLKRLGLLSYQSNPIPADVLLPGVGQGIIAVTCRTNDARTISLLKEVDNHDNRIAATTERSFLDVVDHLSPWSGRPPAAGLMSPPANGKEFWEFRGLLATPDGSKVLTVNETLHSSHCNEAAALNLGRQAAKDLLKQAGDDFLEGYYTL